MEIKKGQAYRKPGEKGFDYFRFPETSIKAGDLEDDEHVIDCVNTPERPRGTVTGAQAKFEENRG